MEVQSVIRAMSILEQLTANPEGVALNDLGHRLGLHVSTCHRILNTLASQGYVEKAADGRQYRLGPAALAIASQWLLNSDLLAVGLHFVNDLVQACNETVHLSILVQDEARDILGKEGTQRIRSSAIPGLRMPLHCTAVGKVLLAFQLERDQERLLSELRLTPYTPRTITAIDELKRQLSEARLNGSAVNEEEYYEESAAVAAPVFDSLGSVVAALGIALPSARFSEGRRRELIEMVVNASQQISAGLGFNPEFRGRGQEGRP